MTQTYLVTGKGAASREISIFNRIDPTLRTAIILEGLSDGNSKLDTPSASDFYLQIARIAPGCLCCSGNMIMRVTLNRLLRNKPEQLFISLANSEHIEQIRHFLTQAPYDELLTLAEDIVCRDAAS